MLAPQPRGPLSELILSWLHDGSARDLEAAQQLAAAVQGDVLYDEDRQITLWALYELHYGGFEDVDDRWEWSPECLAIRATLERQLEKALRDATRDAVGFLRDRPGEVAERLFELVARDRGASVARCLQRTATRAQAREFLIHRSIYNLKEADPHTWAVPRLTGVAKVALVELQYDEYGAGRPERQHARLYAESLAAAGLDSRRGAYIDVVPAVTLTLNNALSMFGLHRRLRGAAMGHLAAFEATSSLPCRQITQGLRRLDLPAAAGVYFDEHIEADAVHEQVATRDICATLVAEDPGLLDDVAFGAAACLYLEGVAGDFILQAWARGDSSLLPDSNALRSHRDAERVAGIVA